MLCMLRLTQNQKLNNNLNTVLRSCCLKQFFYGIDCLIFILYVILCPNLTKVLKTLEWQNLPLLKLSQNARTAMKYCYHREKRKSNKSDIKLRRAFTDKVINLTDEPVVQCNVPVIKKYFCRLW